MERWPELEVYVHELGAPHMLDPSRLVKSASRLYGEDMDRLWGEMLPVPEANLRELRGGERLLEDRFEVAYTPGHASHHVSYLCEGTAFVGDVGGVRIAGGLTIPPTPPPDIDVEAWHALAGHRRGLAAAAAGHDPLRRQRGRRGPAARGSAPGSTAWAQLAREHDQAGFIAAIEREIAAGAPEQVVPAYAQAAPHDQLYMGLERYWAKRARNSG